MPVLRDIPISLTAEQIIASPDKDRIRPALLLHAEETIALGQTLWQPRAVYDWFDLQAIDGEHVTLVTPPEMGDRAVLRVGPKSHLLAAAEQVLVGVVSIGSALEEMVHQLQATGDAMTAYLLDSAGVVALGAAGASLRCLAEDAAAKLGWGVSPSFSPGSLVGWSLRGQRDLCALLPLEEIGVRLNRHCVLEPHKSTSTLVGLGQGYDSARVGSVCKYCALQKTCWRRREDPA
jgi:hypothetical protein